MRRLLIFLAATTLTAADIKVQGSLRSRFEGWNWFDSGTGDPDYAFSGNQARLSFSQKLPKLDWQLEFAAPFLLGLPDRAVLPAPQLQLGMGGNYYQANHNARNTGMVFLKQGFLRFNGIGGDKASSVRFGRFEYSDGTEITPANATLAAVKRDRISQRLIGPFGFTHVGRSFDGVHYARGGSGPQITAIAATPTRGVFQTDGWGWLQTAFVYGAVSGKVKDHTDWRLLALYYQDWRDVLKTDNRPVAARQGDFGNIKIGTYGGHILHVAGPVDLMAWGVVQAGTWGRLDHRAAAIALEGGYQPKILKQVKPWIRAGYFFGSGDKNPNDNRHGTFFEVLPTPRPFARFPFFNLMNLEDRNASLTLRPSKKVTLKSEFHALRLASASDQWLLGGGAFQPWTFGYIGRTSNGHRGLANLYDLSTDYVVNPHLTVSGYVGYAAGHSVIKAIYPKDASGMLAYLEITTKF
ncbi:MAG: alginate export family protein [Bryobacterales bacterium]|nr:alginate export family protein [Bryobacterales bacterium]